MTNEEREQIRACRILIVGAANFLDYVEAELAQMGFGEAMKLNRVGEHADILIEFARQGPAAVADTMEIPAILPFDFVDGAGAIVLYPESDRELLSKSNLRLWTAEYIVGYCTFWHLAGSEWLQKAIPAIQAGVTSETASRNAAHISARIAANMAVGRPVKTFPKFYLSANLK